MPQMRVEQGLMGGTQKDDVFRFHGVPYAAPPSGGILPVVTLSILYRIVPREKIGTAMGLYGLGVVGSPAIPDWLGVWALDQQAQLQTFADAVDWLFIIVAILTAAGVILAMFLPSRPTPAASAGAKTEVLVV